MKPQSTILIALATLLSLPAIAQDAAPPQPTRERAQETRPADQPKAESSRAAEAPEEKPVPFIGVLTREVSPEVRTQLGLQPGFGLLVEEVMPDSPAKEAGIKEHDILVAFDNQRLVNMEQLMALVRSKRKGDSVSVTVISSGKESQVPVTIGERMMPARPEPSRFFGMRPGSGLAGPGRERGAREMPLPGNTEPMERMHQQLRETQERFQQQMREYQERMQNWARGGSRGTVPQPPSFPRPSTQQNDRRPDANTARPHNERDNHQSQHRDFHESASVTRSDESGVYSLRHNDGRTVFTARPKGGEEESWPVNNPAEREALPDMLREKLQELERIRADMHRSSAPGSSRPKPDDDATSRPRNDGRKPERLRESDRDGPRPEGSQLDDGPRGNAPPAPRRDGGSV